MAIHVSKKKEPSKEEYLLKEHMEIEEGVFNKITLQRLAKFFRLGIISKIHFKIATGKESDIFLADPGPKVHGNLVVLKIFRVETTPFRKRLDYIIGDPRFGDVKGAMHAIVNVWCKKEYANLKIATDAKVNAPKPYDFNANILAMQFIGKNGIPAPHLKDVELTDPKDMLDKVIEQTKRLYGAGLVHADLSEYNILVKDNKPYIIDFGQAVETRHPSASEFLKRDLNNIAGFFAKRYNIKISDKELFDIVTG